MIGLLQAVMYTTYYPAGYSNGSLESAIDEERRSGGLCLDGLRLAVFVGSMDTPTPDKPVSSSSSSDIAIQPTKPPIDVKPTPVKPSDKPVGTCSVRMPLRGRCSGTA